MLSHASKPTSVKGTISKALKTDVVICYKQREKANVISHMELIGDVAGKNVVLVDDMVDSRWTLTLLAALLRQGGAGRVYPLALAETTGK